MVERASGNLRIERREDSSRPRDGTDKGSMLNGSVPDGSVVEKSVKLTLPSDHAAARAVQEQILQELARFKFDNQSHFAVKLALEEALINAIKHGNRLDSSKKVHVEYKITARQIEISVEDEGPGFDRGGVPDPTLDENIEKCSGRGILLIEAYMNQVHWSRGGRRLHMIKNNEPDAQA